MKPTCLHSQMLYRNIHVAVGKGAEEVSKIKCYYFTDLHMYVSVGKLNPYTRKLLREKID